MSPELDELRGVDLLEVMSALGYQPIARYTGSCEFRLEDGRKVSVSRTPHNAKKGSESMFQVWNGESFNGKSGGAGAIDLVMTVSNKTFRAALGWLASTFFVAGRVDGPERPPRPVAAPLPLFERRFALPPSSPDALPAVRRYLCESRGLPTTLVVPLLDAGTIFAHVHSYAVNETRRSFTNAVFVMRDDATEAPNGSMIRGCYDGRKPRKSTLPFENGKAAAFWLGVPLAQARAVVVTESPIECLSWLALHTAATETNCRTYGGERWRSVEAIFDQVKASGTQLICAFNNDKEGNRAAGQFLEIAAKAGIVAVRDQPHEVKDWNDTLRRKEAIKASSAMTLGEKFTLISSTRPDAAQPLTQFTPSQIAVFEELIQWLHDYNLHQREKPNFPAAIHKQLTIFEAIRNRQKLDRGIAI